MRYALLSVVAAGWLVGCATFHPGETASRASGGTERSAGGEALEPDAYAGRAPLEVMRGKASYYHDSLAGNRTANGERYDPRGMTAASRTLPFGTVLRVVREGTDHAVIVRVNDRGPFGKRERILDLSRAAAERLHMLGAGVVRVRAEILERGGK